MIINVPQDISNVSSWQELQKFTSQTLTLVVAAINGRINITENTDGQIIEVNFPAANTTIAVQHGLNRVASNYFRVGGTTNLNVFDGSGSNTKNTLYVQSSAAGNARLYVF